ncbi:MAG: LLM class flavin-dependent oxidoreductase [Dehalococcoidia bacterium]
MEIGIGLDSSLGLHFEQQRELARQAVMLGYRSAWTPAGGTTPDSFHVCSQWSAATQDLVLGGLKTGISVLPVPLYSAAALAATAATLADLTDGRFTLGIGSGSIYSASYRRSFGLPDYQPLSMMRDYLLVLHRLLVGETVDYEGPAITLHGARLTGFDKLSVPLYLGALGPQMLRLAGEAADGVALNWCTPEQIAWSRRRINEGAQRAGRDSSSVAVMEYIRICIDDDEDAARKAFARAVMGYALARPGASKQHGYRAHFGRMGFDAELTKLESRREAGAADAEIADAFPAELLRLVGYFGPAGRAAAAFKRLAEGLDIAVVRVVPARKGIEAVSAVMEACRPELIEAV